MKYYAFVLRDNVETSDLIDRSLDNDFFHALKAFEASGSQEPLLDVEC